MARQCYVDILKVGTTNYLKKRTNNITASVELNPHPPNEQRRPYLSSDFSRSHPPSIGMRATKKPSKTSRGSSLTPKPGQTYRGPQSLHVLRKPELIERMTTWSVELFEFSLKYEPKGAIKSQALVDFIVEMTFAPEADPRWTLHVDGSLNLKGSRASIILEGLEQVVLEHSLKFDFKTSNNQADYEALLPGLDFGLKVNTFQIVCHSDS
ncbi:hypothetical protein CR513_08531, partial [Mucuna pruriens]